MFTKKITDADEFITLPSSTQALYLHLCMSADDDGFNNQVQMSMFKAHASIDDVKILLAKRFILQFENGVIVIKHWRMANALRKDRYTKTNYKEELSRLRIKENGAYTMTDTADELRLPDGCQMVATDKGSIGKGSIGKGSIGESEGAQKYRYGIFNNVKLTEDELQTLIEEYPDSYQEKIENLSQYMKSKGTYYHDHFATIMKWAREDEAKKPQNKGADNLNQFYDMVRDWAQEGESQ
jgi:hypothetical protein